MGVLSFSAYQINPQISFISEEVLREKYIKGFYYRKSDLVNRNKNLVERVEDSIERLNTKLRETCSKEISFLNLPESRIKSERTKYVVFYSPLCNNGIYVEVVPAKSVLFYENKYSYIGEVNQYYFVFNDKHEIKKCYTGILNRD
jgi:hypothetical protein